MSDPPENPCALVLASRSPRRALLLTEAGYRIRIEPSGIEEKYQERESPSEVVRRLALEKALAVAARCPGAPVLGSDTIVVLDGNLMGIPRDRADSRSMIERLSGRTHEVHTGVALVWNEDRQIDSDVAIVKFHALSADQIRDYVVTGEGDDKAGGYAYQGQGGCLIDSVSGDPQTVIGLPVRMVDDMVRKWRLELKQSR